jgi:FtsZ-interacting cell division protein ZipA
MRLHMLNFFGFKKTLTIIPGTTLLLLIGSGLWLSRRRKARTFRDAGSARKGEKKSEFSISA